MKQAGKVSAASKAYVCAKCQKVILYRERYFTLYVDSSFVPWRSFWKANSRVCISCGEELGLDRRRKPYQMIKSKKPVGKESGI
jgi:predicted RNA-binding Zn-ribbon protein involved in translation (DUF1610 family)